MQFDLQQAPPSAAELVAGRRALRRKIDHIDAQLRRCARLEVALAVGGLFGAVVLGVVLDTWQVGIPLALLAGAAVLGVAVTGVELRAITQREAAEAHLELLSRLDVLTAPDCHADLLDWARREAVVQCYLTQLAAEGRQPVVGEWQAARDRIAEASL